MQQVQLSQEAIHILSLSPGSRTEDQLQTVCKLISEYKCLDPFHLNTNSVVLLCESEKREHFDLTLTCQLCIYQSHARSKSKKNSHETMLGFSFAKKLVYFYGV